MVLGLGQARVVHDAQVDERLDLSLAEDVLDLALADVELVHRQILGPALERAAVETRDALGAVQLARERPPEVAADPGDEDHVAHQKKSPPRSTRPRSIMVWICIFTSRTRRSSSLSSSSGLPTKRIGSPK